MKKICLFVFAILFAVPVGFGVSIEDLVKKNRKGSDPEFPPVRAENFEVLQEKAIGGDAPAQKKVVDFLTSHVSAVYAPLKSSGGLLFSVRKPVRGYDDAEHNYAVNLEEFFEETCDDVRVRKKDFEVKTKEGFSFHVSLPQYRPSDEAVELKMGEQAVWTPLADLRERDRRFIENALEDDIFESSRGLEISVEDVRLGEAERKDESLTIGLGSETRIKGAFSSAAAEQIRRTLVLENKGQFPLRNLVIEYQSFVEQQLMWMPKDFPEDYRVVGMLPLKVLAPGEIQRIEISLPDIVEAKTEEVVRGNTSYSVVVPSDQNNKSEGRMNGIWVRVSRFTPYGERLEREYKSAGVPSAKWDCVAPVHADIR